MIDAFDFEPATQKMREDVLRGLGCNPKRLPSQYLYDERGARLFEKICDTREYYLTRTEIDIMETHMDAIIDLVGVGAMVIEPGSGSGIKTKLLLENLPSPAGYVPIDVAKDQLNSFASKVNRRFSELRVVPVCADFMSQYELPKLDVDVGKRVTYFPGSTIGNFTPDVAEGLLFHMGELCEEDGGVLIGVDLKKDPEVIEAAYDDEEGISRQFALNYLVRLNRELDADFDLNLFDYEAPYNAEIGRVEMALVSLRRQTVDVDDIAVSLDKGERIHTEYSYKYAPQEFEALARRAGLTVEAVWTDEDQLFSVQYLVRR